MQKRGRDWIHVLFSRKHEITGTGNKVENHLKKVREADYSSLERNLESMTVKIQAASNAANIPQI